MPNHQFTSAAGLDGLSHLSKAPYAICHNAAYAQSSTANDPWSISSLPARTDSPIGCLSESRSSALITTLARIELKISNLQSTVDQLERLATREQSGKDPWHYPVFHNSEEAWNTVIGGKKDKGFSETVIQPENAHVEPNNQQLLQIERTLNMIVDCLERLFACIRDINCRLDSHDERLAYVDDRLRMMLTEW